MLASICYAALGMVLHLFVSLLHLIWPTPWFSLGLVFGGWPGGLGLLAAVGADQCGWGDHSLTWGGLDGPRRGHGGARRQCGNAALPDCRSSRGRPAGLRSPDGGGRCSFSRHVSARRPRKHWDLESFGPESTVPSQLSASMSSVDRRTALTIE